MTAAIHSGAIIVAGDAVDVRAHALVKADAETHGISAGLAAVGVSFAEAVTDATVTASLGGNINAAGVTVSAEQTYPNGGYAAKSFAGGSAGGLIGVDATDSTARAKGDISSYIADNAVLNVRGAVVVEGNHASRQRAEASSVVGGLVAAGVSFGNATSDTTTNAYTGSNVTINAGSLHITAYGEDDNFVDVIAGSGGVAAGAGATGDTSNTSTTLAKIGAGNTIDLGADRQLPLVAAGSATFDSHEGVQTINRGDTVDVAAGHAAGGNLGTVYEYIGESAGFDTNDGEQRIAQGTTVDVLAGHTGSGEIGNRYRYIAVPSGAPEPWLDADGNPLLDADGNVVFRLPTDIIDLQGADFGNTGQWQNLGSIRTSSASIDLGQQNFSDTNNWRAVAVTEAHGELVVNAEHEAIFNADVGTTVGGAIAGSGAYSDHRVNATVDAVIGSQRRRNGA